MLSRQILHQGNLGLSDLVRINTSNAEPFFVHMKHDLDGFRLFLMKDVLKNLYNKLFSRVIVVVE
jgi:hypothetical protein